MSPFGYLASVDPLEPLRAGGVKQKPRCVPARPAAQGKQQRSNRNRRSLETGESSGLIRCTSMTCHDRMPGVVAASIIFDDIYILLFYSSQAYIMEQFDLHTHERTYLGSYLRAVRFTRDLTLSGAARRIGLSHTALGMIERGMTKRPDRDTLERIADTYNLSSKRLVARADRSASRITDSAPQNDARTPVTLLIDNDERDLIHDVLLFVRRGGSR